MYAVDPEQAGELAIAAIELILTGQISSDDVMIDLMLQPTKVINERNVEKYEQKLESGRAKKIHDQKLDQIAELIQKGLKQREVAERLGLTQQVVSYRWSVIKASYPELLLEKSGNPQDFTKKSEDVYKNTKEIYKNTKELDESFVKEEPVKKSDTGRKWQSEFDF